MSCIDDKDWPNRQNNDIPLPGGWNQWLWSQRAEAEGPKTVKENLNRSLTACSTTDTTSLDSVDDDHDATYTILLQYTVGSFLPQDVLKERISVSSLDTTARR
jgi:hypothetical protein